MATGLASLNPMNWFNQDASGWSTSNWSNFAAQGGTVSDSGALIDKSGKQVGQMSWNDKTGSWNTKDVGTAQNSASGTMSTIGSIGSAATGLGSLANAYLGYKNYQLAEDKFDYEKALSNANLYNSGTAYNTKLANMTAVGNSLAGSTLTDAQKAANVEATKANYAKTTI